MDASRISKLMEAQRVPHLLELHMDELVAELEQRTEQGLAELISMDAERFASLWSSVAS